MDDSPPRIDGFPHLRAGSLQAVLMDLDGTLVDTEQYWIAAEYALVAEHGGTWSDEHARAIVGNALLTAADYLRAHGGVDLPSARIVEILSDTVAGALGRRVPWRPGARELLAAARGEGIPCALVTMSYSELARAVIDRLPGATFGAVVTGDEVRYGKPHPEPYLTAAERLGVDPRACLAIEDSPTGIASAESAGCAVLAVPNQVPIERAGSRVVRPSLAGLDVAGLRAVFAVAAGARPSRSPAA